MTYLNGTCRRNLIIILYAFGIMPGDMRTYDIFTNWKKTTPEFRQKRTIFYKSYSFMSCNNLAVNSFMLHICEL